MTHSFNVELLDGTQFEVTPDIRDTLAAETAFRKNKAWGPVAESPIRFGSYRIWNAAQRTGKTTQSWLAFTEGDNCLANYSVIEDEPAGDELEEAADRLGKDTPTDQPAL